MRQSRVISLSSPGTNVMVGYAVAVLVLTLVFPAFGFEFTLGQNLAIGLVFTTVSIVRSYVRRWLFEAIR